MGKRRNTEGIRFVLLSVSAHSVVVCSRACSAAARGSTRRHASGDGQTSEIITTFDMYFTFWVLCHGAYRSEVDLSFDLLPRGPLQRSTIVWFRSNRLADSCRHPQSDAFCLSCRGPELKGKLWGCGHGNARAGVTAGSTGWFPALRRDSLFKTHSTPNKNLKQKPNQNLDLEQLT